MADLQQLFQLGQQVQGRLQQLQSELASRTIETSAGGGMVQGDRRRPGHRPGGRRSIPPSSQDHDAEFLSDLVLTAVAEAQRRAAEMLQAEMRKVPPLPVRVAVLTGERDRGADHRARQAARESAGRRPSGSRFICSSNLRNRLGRLAAALRRSRERVRPCEECGNLTEEQPCGICRDPRRDRGAALRGRGAVHGRRGGSLRPTSGAVTTCSAAGSRRWTASARRRCGSTAWCSGCEDGGGARGHPRDQSLDGGRGDRDLHPAAARGARRAGHPAGARAARWAATWNTSTASPWPTRSWRGRRSADAVAARWVFAGGVLAGAAAGWVLAQRRFSVSSARSVQSARRSGASPRWAFWPGRTAWRPCGCSGTTSPGSGSRCCGGAPRRSCARMEATLA